MYFSWKLSFCFESLELDDLLIDDGDLSRQQQIRQLIENTLIHFLFFAQKGHFKKIILGDSWFKVLC